VKHSNLFDVLKSIFLSLISIPLGRPRRSWEDNIKINLQEVGYEGINRNELAQDRDRWQELVNAVMNLQVQKMPGMS
jgi:hypothetical protein